MNCILHHKIISIPHRYKYSAYILNILEMSACKRKGDRKDSEKKLKQNAKRSRLEIKIPVRLLDLPVGPLHMIFSKLPLESQKLLRNISKEMRDEHNDFVLHNYKLFSHQLRKIKENDNEEHRVLKVSKILYET